MDTKNTTSKQLKDKIETNAEPTKQADTKITQKRLQSKCDDNSSKIPLHTGSRVYVSKAILAQIFIPNPCIYTSRLTELVFGLETLKEVAKHEPNKHLSMLDKDMLQSVLSKYKIC